MNELQESTGDILPPNPIRVETALSRYPVHRLAKHGDISINIRRTDENGEALIRWEVSYNSKYGQPGPLAYKLDTLIINRRIEEAARPIPNVIRIGTLNDICRELESVESGKNTNRIKNALYQNAAAFITAKIRYKARDGTERDAEIGDTRYGVVFTGEELPDGRRADAVHIVLHPFYKKILDETITRPLDYDYLKTLPPAPQRFYELLSYQIYAAIRNDRPRAKLLYSELCTYAPLVRQADWNVVRPQLARIHTPHIKSGYVGKIDCQHIVDNDGLPDYILLYQPGPKARADFRAFAKRGEPGIIDSGPFTDAPPALASSRQAHTASQQPALPLAEPEPSPQEAALIGHGISPPQAAELARQHEADRIGLYIEYLEWEIAKKPGKVKDPAAWLFTAIRDGRRIPKTFVSKAERQRQKEAAEAKQRAEAEQRRQKQQEAAREDAERQEVNTYWKALSKTQQAELEAAALAAADEATRQTYESLKRDGSGGGYLALIRRNHIRHILKNRHDRNEAAGSH